MTRSAFPDRTLWILADVTVLLPGGQVTREYRAWRPTEAEAVAEVRAQAPVGAEVVAVRRVTRRTGFLPSVPAERDAG